MLIKELARIAGSTPIMDDVRKIKWFGYMKRRNIAIKDIFEGMAEGEEEDQREHGRML